MPRVIALPFPLPATGEAARFVVGQDRQGHWIAVEIHGRGGGLFRNRQAAFHYAESETGRRRGGVIVAGERIELRL
jgi:hypothetical protein